MTKEVDGWFRMHLYTLSQLTMDGKKRTREPALSVATQRICVALSPSLVLAVEAIGTNNGESTGYLTSCESPNCNF